MIWRLIGSPNPALPAVEVVNGDHDDNGKLTGGEWRVLHLLAILDGIGALLCCFCCGGRCRGLPDFGGDDSGFGFDDGDGEEEEDGEGAGAGGGDCPRGKE